jgi:hypothetical protein
MRTRGAIPTAAQRDGNHDDGAAAERAVRYLEGRGPLRFDMFGSEGLSGGQLPRPSDPGQLWSASSKQQVS